MIGILAIDYDGTLFEGKWPHVGQPRRAIINQAIAFRERGTQVILWTCREKQYLDEAVRRCQEVGLEFDAINDNLPIIYERMRANDATLDAFCKRKIFADIYVDDRSPGSIEFFLNLDPDKSCPEPKVEIHNNRKHNR